MWQKYLLLSGLRFWKCIKNTNYWKFWVCQNGTFCSGNQNLRPLYNRYFCHTTIIKWSQIFTRTIRNCFCHGPDPKDRPWPSDTLLACCSSCWGIKRWREAKTSCHMHNTPRTPNIWRLSNYALVLFFVPGCPCFVPGCPCFVPGSLFCPWLSLFCPWLHLFCPSFCRTRRFGCCPLQS